MKIWVLISIFCCYLVIVAATDDPSNDEPDYYWKDFTGVLPSDAFNAGNDSRGYPIFIGQVPHLYTVTNYVAVVPIHVYGNDYRGEYVYDAKAHTVTKNFKILCTQFPGKYEWIKTDNVGLRFLLPRKVFVEGGHDEDHPLLIGKTPNAGGKVGKVTLYYKYAGLSYVEGNVAKGSHSFEVLAYKPIPKQHIYIGYIYV